MSYRRLRTRAKLVALVLETNDSSAFVEVRLVSITMEDARSTPISGVVPTSAIVANRGSMPNFNPDANSLVRGSAARQRRKKRRRMKEPRSATPMMPVLLKMFANQFDVRAEPRPTPSPFVVKKASTATLVHMVRSA
jgi:hypothetical protein